MALASAAIVAFVPTTDLAPGADFYGGVLGLTVEETNDFACVLRGGGTMLRRDQSGLVHAAPVHRAGLERRRPRRDHVRP